MGHCYDIKLWESICLIRPSSIALFLIKLSNFNRIFFIRELSLLDSNWTGFRSFGLMPNNNIWQPDRLCYHDRVYTTIENVWSEKFWGEKRLSVPMGNSRPVGWTHCITFQIRLVSITCDIQHEHSDHKYVRINQTLSHQNYTLIINQRAFLSGNRQLQLQILWPGSTSFN